MSKSNKRQNSVINIIRRVYIMLKVDMLHTFKYLWSLFNLFSIIMMIGKLYTAWITFVSEGRSQKKSILHFFYSGLFLLHCSSTSTGAKTTTPLMGTSGAPPGPPLKAHEILNLRCSVLACSSYVSLVLGDNVVALQHAKDLLAIPGLAGSLKWV